MDEPVGDLTECVTRALSAVVGSTLRQVVIRALDGEVADRAELSDPMLCVGGEVRLEFGGRLLFVSWVSCDGWSDHFSIGVRHQSLFVPGALLRDWNVSDLEPWSKCVGKRLRGAKVFSFEGTPHVVELSFDEQVWWMADGYQHAIGDGDDLLIRSGSFPVSGGVEVAWAT